MSHIELPKAVSDLFELFKSVGQPLQPFSNSFECLLRHYKWFDMTRKHLYLLEQFLWSLILPTFVVTVMYLPIYLVLKALGKSWKFNISLFIIPTYVYLYLEFLPTLYYNSLSFLTCRVIAGIKYVIGDNQYRCDSKENGLLSANNIGLALPIFLI
jgi:hypothetical protein